jgi:hypothetical protein
MVSDVYWHLQVLVPPYMHILLYINDDYQCLAVAVAWRHKTWARCTASTFDLDLAFFTILLLWCVAFTELGSPSHLSLKTTTITKCMHRHASSCRAGMATLLLALSPPRTTLHPSIARHSSRGPLDRSSSSRTPLSVCMEERNDSNIIISM